MPYTYISNKKTTPKRDRLSATRLLEQFSKQLYQLFYVLGWHEQKNDRKGNVH